MKHDKEYIEEYFKNHPDSKMNYQFVTFFKYLDKVGVDEDRFDTLTKPEFIEMIKQLDFQFVRSINIFTTNVYKYGEWLYNKGYIQTENYKKFTAGISGTMLIASHEDKYIPKEDFYELYNKLMNDYDELETNNFYVATLIRTIYEGGYCGNWYSIIYLRARDINVDTNMITVRFDDGTSGEIYVSHQLAVDLLKVAEIDTWYQIGRYGIISVPLVGKYNDSVFKYIERDGSNVRSAVDGVNPNFYRTRIHKALNDYLGCKYQIQHIYMSGIIHRVTDTAETNGYTFADVLKNTPAAQYLKDEINRLYNTSKYHNFRVNLRSDFKHLVKKNKLY